MSKRLDLLPGRNSSDDAHVVPSMTETAWRRRYRLLLELSRAAVVWESVWPRAWPVLGVLGAFFGLAMFDVLPALPYWLHGTVLLGFAALLGHVLRTGIAGFRAAGLEAGRHRLERDSGLRHRPLTAIDDRLFTDADDPAARALWREHLYRVAQSLGTLRLDPPAPGMAKRDPRALRAAVLLFVVVGVGVGGSDIGGRWTRAVTPELGRGAGALSTLEVWITPPVYTGLPPLMLERARTKDGSAPVAVPVGSGVMVQLGGGSETPVLSIGGRAVPFGETGPGSFRAETTVEDIDLSGNGTLAVMRRNRAIASWPVDILPDKVPEIAFTAPPRRVDGVRLRFEYEAKDDYGLMGAAAVIRHPQGLKVPGGGTELRIELPLSSMGAQASKGASVHDLTAHPWAGLSVVGHLEAKDGRGQVGKSEPAAFVIPERVFNHPVARALVEQRKKLSEANAAVVAEVMDALDEISRRPQQFFDDTTVFLAIRIARSRLKHNREGEAGIASVQTLLWDTALRIEEGELAVAERELRLAQERLMQALQRQTDMAELDRLMDELQQALDKFMNALREQLARNPMPEMPFNPETMQMVESSELQRMIEEARELAKTGSIEAAKQRLAELQRMLEALQGGMQMNPQAMQRMKQAGKMMEAMRSLTQRQQQLLDRNFQRLKQQRQGQRQPGQQGQRQPGQRQQGELQQGEGEPSDETDADAAEQDELRRMLGDMMLQLDEMLGGIPGEFGEAERAMRDAAEALRQGRPGQAVPPQTDALENLKKAMEGAQQQMAQRMGNMPGLMQGEQRMPPNQRRDPFGRNIEGAHGSSIDGPVKVPDKMDLRRAREILDELRRRAGEHTRPKLERNYIDRLLKTY